MSCKLDFAQPGKMINITTVKGDYVKNPVYVVNRDKSESKLICMLIDQNLDFFSYLCDCNKSDDKGKITVQDKQETRPIPIQVEVKAVSPNPNATPNQKILGLAQTFKKNFLINYPGKERIFVEKKDL